jgi:hypothetical protein
MPEKGTEMGFKDKPVEEDLFGALPEFEPDDSQPSADDIKVEIVEEDEGGTEASESEGEEGAEGEDEEVTEDSEGTEEGTEEAVEAVGNEDDTPNDPEYLSYSKNVRKRIDREVKLRKKEVGQMREQLQYVQQQSQQQVQEVSQKEQQAQQALLHMQENYVTLLETSITKDITTAQQKLRTAKDEGDSEKEVAAMSELQTLIFQKQQTEEVKSQLAAKKVAAAAPTPPPEAKPNPLAQRWVSKNKEIFTNPKFRSKAIAIRVIDADMAKEGWNAQTESYYKELDRRIDEEFPGLRKKPVGKNSVKGPKSPVAPANGAGGNSQPHSNVVRLTRADLENMRRYNLDPTNKEHLKQYARSKVAG